MATTHNYAMRLQLREFLLQKFPAAKKRSLTDDTPLLESGIVDSLGILDVVTFLEHTFGIQLADDELTAENFGSVNHIIDFLEKKLAAEPQVSAG